MPWETDGDLVRFTGPLSDLMDQVMTAYDEDTQSGSIEVASGAYATATAIVLREVLLEGLAGREEAAELLSRLNDAFEETGEGTVAVKTLAILDDIAEHIAADAWEQWLVDPGARAAIREVAGNTFSG